MQAVLTTLFFQHDLRLVALAAVICALASFASISLVNHARGTTGAMQKVWLAVAAISVGFGIWSTHFVAMLSYKPGITLGYDLPLTILSLAIAIGITGGGLWFAAAGTRRSDIALGGAIVGLGIAAMHYVGMAAVVVGGQMRWDPTLVASSAVLGMAFGAGALTLGTVANTLKWRVIGAGMLVLGIVSMHFTGMGAVGMQNCYSLVAADDATWRALFISVAAREHPHPVPGAGRGVSRRAGPSAHRAGSRPHARPCRCRRRGPDRLRRQHHRQREFQFSGSFGPAWR
jgi:NO-binding membrane sensor protein with MHYT domain